MPTGLDAEIDATVPPLDLPSTLEPKLGGLRVRTLGHATLALYRDGEDPLLLTDPWLVGSVYWRSWWLQNYPSAEEIEWLSTSAYVYVTHEHPDHFHMPSIRRLGSGPDYLLPETCNCLDFLNARGFRAAGVEPLRWRALDDGVSLLSIPVWNDDSLLLIDTPEALILNLNDAKPPPPLLGALRRLGDRVAKPRVLLCSYSPASLVNSFLDGDRIVSLRPARHYVDYVCRLCERLSVDYYLPFASQAVFCRGDSAWANEYRTSYADLCRHWASRARLLPPHTTLDLADFSHGSIPAEHYRPMEPARLAAPVIRREAEEAAAEISAEEVALFERKLNKFRWLLRIMLPRGFAFRLGERCLVYDPKLGRLHAAADRGGEVGDFVVEIPKLTLKEALHNNHLSDLGITMFVRIRLRRKVDPRKAYALFVLFQLDDCGHLAGPAALIRWLRRGLRYNFARRLPAPRTRRSAGIEREKM
jgi:hypothetical protein